MQDLAEMNLDLFLLKDVSATDPDTLPPLAEIAAEMADSLELALKKFKLVAVKLGAVSPTMEGEV